MCRILIPKCIQKRVRQVVVELKVRPTVRVCTWMVKQKSTWSAGISSQVFHSLFMPKQGKTVFELIYRHLIKQRKIHDIVFKNFFSNFQLHRCLLYQKDLGSQKRCDDTIYLKRLKEIVSKSQRRNLIYSSIPCLRFALCVVTVRCVQKFKRQSFAKVTCKQLTMNLSIYGFRL